MMVKDSKHITHLIEDGLRDAINELKSKQIDSSQGEEIHFKRIVFSGENNLVVVEIRQEQQRDLPESFFTDGTTQQALLAHSNCSRVDVIDLGESTFIYCWINSNEQGEKTEALNLIHAIP